MDTGQLQQDLDAALDPGERLLWSGIPRQGWMFRPTDWVLVPISFIWCSLAIAWEVTVFAGEPDVPDQFDLWDIGFMLWGVPFVIVGLYFLAGRFVADMRIRARTIYGLTDRRVLALQELRRRGLRTLDLDALGELHLSEGKDGRGTIRFGGMGFYGALTFEGIASARTVLQRIRDARASALGRS